MNLERRLAYVRRLAGTVVFSVTMLPYLVACGLRDPPAGLRAHALVFQRMGGGRTELSTPPMRAGAGPTVTVVGVGRGDIGAFQMPTSDPGGLQVRQLGVTHSYTNWPKSGTALYVAEDSAGGSQRAIRVSTPATDEVTLAAVVVDGRRIVDVAWNEVLAGSPLTSGKVTTTGPATLVAFWWGDADVLYDKKAVPEGGFQVLDAVLESGALVQCAVAMKHVAAAGTYDVTWRARPVQGAQMWIVAVE